MQLNFFYAFGLLLEEYFWKAMNHFPSSAITHQFNTQTWASVVSDTDGAWEREFPHVNCSLTNATHVMTKWNEYQMNNVSNMIKDAKAIWVVCHGDASLLMSAIQTVLRGIWLSI